MKNERIKCWVVESITDNEELEIEVFYCRNHGHALTKLRELKKNAAKCQDNIERDFTIRLIDSDKWE